MLDEHDDPNTDNNIAETILKESKKPIEICSEKHIKRIALPPGWEMKEINNEGLLDSPVRIKRNLGIDDMESFNNYINRHKSPESSTIYCQANYKQHVIRFTAVIDDHSLNSPKWQNHIAKFKPEFSVEYQTWINHNQESMSQIEFATFLEDNMDDIGSDENMPTGAQLLQMALKFEASQDMRLKSHVRLQSGGIQMQFVQDDDEATINKMTMFEKMSIAIPIFWNGKPYRINARLKYRVREGQAKFWYELIRPEKVFEAACNTIIDNIKTGTDLPFFFGSWSN